MGKTVLKAFKPFSMVVGKHCGQNGFGPLVLVCFQLSIKFCTLYLELVITTGQRGFSSTRWQTGRRHCGRMNCCLKMVRDGDVLKGVGDKEDVACSGPSTGNAALSCRYPPKVPHCA